MAAYLTTIFPLQATRSLYHRARRIFARGKSFVRSLPVMTSHPPFADEWTIFGRPGARSPGNALWLHFQVKDDHSTLVVAPPVSGAVDETRLVADLEFHLAQLASLAERCAPAAEPAAAG
jgi:hypothetical protein